MSYTYGSLTFAWLITLALFAASASGGFVGWWFVVLLAVAFAAPGSFSGVQPRRTPAHSKHDRGRRTGAFTA
jgi:hypothetical protein